MEKIEEEWKEEKERKEGEGEVGGGGEDVEAH